MTKNTRNHCALVTMMILAAALSACAPEQPKVTAPSHPNFTGIWAAQLQYIQEGPAEGIPMTLRNTDWKPLSAGAPEQQKAKTLEEFKAEMEKVVAANIDVFAHFRSTAFKPPLTEVGMAAQKAMVDTRAKTPPPVYAQCVARNSIGIGVGMGGTAQVFQTDKRVAVIPENGPYRNIYLDGEAGREASATSYVGYSAASWQGNSLVVSTTNFSGETINGWPASDQAKVEETWSLSPDGNLLTVKIVYSDPKYLMEPVARMIYMDKKPEDYLLVPIDCLDNISGGEEFQKLLGHNF